MKHVEGRRILAKHKVKTGRSWFRLPKELYVTEQGIRIEGKFDIPYSSMIEISVPEARSGDLDFLSDVADLTGLRRAPFCRLHYSDERGLHKELEIVPWGTAIPTKAIKLYWDILFASGSAQHRIRQRPAKKLVTIAQQLRAIGVECEFIEPQIQQKHGYGDLRRGQAGTDAEGDFVFVDSEGNVVKRDDPLAGPCEIAENYWSRDLGGLKFRATNVDVVRVIEQGWVVYTPIAGVAGTASSTGVSVNTSYEVDYTIRAQTSARIACEGKPEKQVLIRVVDYVWKGGKFAKRLKEDAQLREMLIRAKAPPIEIKANHIHVKGDKFPSRKLFECIDVIAGHVRREASWSAI